MGDVRRSRFSGVGRAGLGSALLGLMLCACCGCVERRMTVRTNPPGALLYVDDYQIGETPISVNFTYYGDRKIRLVKDGYETLTVLQPVSTPWYEFFPMDFVAENLVPGEIRDHRTLDFQLKPQVVVPTEQLLARAEELRRGSHLSASATVSPAIGPPATGPGSVAPLYAPPAGGEVIPTPQGIGGQPVRSLPGGR
jgi:hypothetical protein